MLKGVCPDEEAEEAHPPRILKVRSHPRRADAVVLSDEPGFLALYHVAPVSGKTRRIRTEGSVTDSPINGDFALHPSEPWVFATRDHSGDQQCDLWLIDMERGTQRKLAVNIGRVEFLTPYKEDAVIAVATTAERVRVLRIALDGVSRLLYETDQQIASWAISERHATGFASIGRRTTCLAAIDLESGGLRQRVVEAGRARHSSLAVDPEADLLAHSQSIEGAEERLVIRCLATMDILQEATVPGDVGLFVQDLGFLAWANSDTILASVGRHGSCSVQAFDRKAVTWSEPLIDGAAEYLARSSDGTYFVASGLTFSNSLYRYAHRAVQPLTRPLRRSALHIESHVYESFDGEKVQGWLHRCAHPDARLAVLCHGGPTYADVNRWEDEPNLVGLLQGLGYHVFQPNYRGSTTFGARFMNLNVGDSGGGDLKDILFGAHDVARRLGIRAKPVILGASYGGYLTLMALTTQPSLWSGGIALVPVADFAWSYRLADAHYRRLIEHLFGGSPSEKPALYRERSPMTHLEHLESPLLIVAGRNDPAAAWAPVRAFAEEAEQQAKPIRVVSFDGGHGVGNAETADLLTHEISTFLRDLPD